MLDSGHELEPLRWRPLRLSILAIALTLTLLFALSLLAADPDTLLGRSGGAIGLLCSTLVGFGLAYLAVARSRRGELGASISHHALAAVPCLFLLERFCRHNALASLRRPAAIVGAGLGVCVLALWQLDLAFGFKWSLSCLALAASLLVFTPFPLTTLLVGLHRHR